MLDECPCCGSKKALMKRHQTTSVPIPYGDPASFVETYYHCDVCLMDVDSSFGDSVTFKAIQKANIESVPKMLKDLNDMGVHKSYFERALRIPFDTTDKWIKGEVTKTEIALLRIIRTYPWILEVADDNFEKDAALVAAYKNLVK